MRPEQGARRSRVRRRPTRTGRSAPVRAGDGSRAQAAKRGSDMSCTQAPAGRRTSAAAGSKSRGLAQAWRRKSAAVATEGSVMGSPGCPKNSLRTGNISRKSGDFCSRRRALGERSRDLVCCWSSKTAKSERTDEAAIVKTAVTGRPLNGLNANPVDFS
jgi:hypothetical protein